MPCAPCPRSTSSGRWPSFVCVCVLWVLSLEGEATARSVRLHAASCMSLEVWPTRVRGLSSCCARRPPSLSCERCESPLL